MESSGDWLSNNMNTFNTIYSYTQNDLVVNVFFYVLYLQFI